MARRAKKDDEFNEWFDEVLLNARIVDARYPVKGFIVYLENGRKVIESVQRILEGKLEADGHRPMTFPIVATEENFSKEAEHIKGFHGEVFRFRIPSDEDGRELIVRPTSETIIYPMFSIWIKSHADLPFKVHQSCQVYRYETKATRPLYRVREVLWNEAHTAHVDERDAEAQFLRAVEIYKEVLDDLAISYVILKRPDFDKFAGAVYSVAFDAWNPDGRVNQVATVHNLGENFSRVFEITYETKEGGRRYVWQLCYGLGYSRVLAAIIAQHGDDLGPIFPPRVAPIQIVVVPIPYKGVEESVYSYAREIAESLGGRFRTLIDDRRDTTPGEKFYHWERQGVPLRIEIGPREVENSTITLTRRDSGERIKVERESAVQKIDEILLDIQDNLRKKSMNVMRDMVIDVRSMDELIDGISRRKICRVNWCGLIECAMEIKSRVAGEIRGYNFEMVDEPFSNCIACSGDPVYVVYVARAY
ncbi:MAG: proline--tRNA ligase [Aigarchaeota archaeon]|nr:proline--tRNA ligase [Aigarchaeota archaeon]